MPQRTLRIAVWCLAVLVLLAMWHYARRDAPRAPLVVSGDTMGTTYSVKLVALPPGTTLTDMRRDVQEALDDVERRMSTYDAGSELSRWNDSASTDWQPVSAETARVVAEAVRLGDLTGGALDVTVGPVLALWHFGARQPGGGPDDAASLDEPDAADLTEALGRVDYRRIDARLDPPAVRKTQPGVQVDLSAIAKGFAVDQVAKRLERLGVEDYMVEVGGEVRTRGVSARGGPWRIGVESPRPGLRTVQRVVELSDGSLATSGDYRNYYERDGRRYCHIIDPRTGRPIDHRLASVTVVHPSCMTADGLATALMVLGPEEALELAERLELPALLIVQTDAGFEERATRTMTAMLDGR